MAILIPPITPTARDRTFDQPHPFDVRAFVNGMANQFESDQQITVTTEARVALIAPALPHGFEIADALGRGALTIQALEHGVLQVLKTARDIATKEGKKRLDAGSIQQSMRRDCPLVFWC